jgi:hypothetical protein
MDVMETFCRLFEVPIFDSTKALLPYLEKPDMTNSEFRRNVLKIYRIIGNTKQEVNVSDTRAIFMTHRQEMISRKGNGGFLFLNDDERIFRRLKDEKSISCLDIDYSSSSNYHDFARKLGIPRLSRIKQILSSDTKSNLTSKQEEHVKHAISFFICHCEFNRISFDGLSHLVKFSEIGKVFETNSIQMEYRYERDRGDTMQVSKSKCVHFDVGNSTLYYSEEVQCRGTQQFAENLAEELVPRLSAELTFLLMTVDVSMMAGRLENHGVKLSENLKDLRQKHVQSVDLSSKYLSKSEDLPQDPEAWSIYRATRRDPAFRPLLLSRYGEDMAVCMMTGTRLALQAAHIKPLSVGRQEKDITINYLGNGLLLCMDWHFLFDQKYWGIKVIENNGIYKFEIVLGPSMLKDSRYIDLIEKNGCKAFDFDFVLQKLREEEDYDHERLFIENLKASWRDREKNLK